MYCAYVSIHTNTYMRTLQAIVCVHACVSVCLCACIRVCVHVCMRCVCVCICARIHACVCACVRALCVCVHMCAHSCVCVHKLISSYCVIIHSIISLLHQVEQHLCPYTLHHFEQRPDQVPCHLHCVPDWLFRCILPGSAIRQTSYIE